MDAPPLRAKNSLKNAKCGRFVDGRRFLQSLRYRFQDAKNDESHVTRGFEDGGPNRTRTCDQRIMSPLL